MATPDNCNCPHTYTDEYQHYCQAVQLCDCSHLHIERLLTEGDGDGWLCHQCHYCYVEGKS